MLVAYVAISLDGFIAGKKDDLSFLPEYSDTDFGYKVFYQTMDAVIMGYDTYRVVKDFTPFPYEGKPTYVVTSKSIQDNRIKVISFDSISKLKEKRIYVSGGGKLISSLIEEKLIDELRIFIIPVTIGEGIPLFQKVHSTWTVNRIQNHPHNVIECCYVREPATK